MSSTLKLSTRVRALAPSPTLAVDAEARRLREEGRAVIGFGAGEPDFPTPLHVQEAAERAASDRKNHGYTGVPGLPALREAIADRTAARWGSDVDPAKVVVSNGGKHSAYLVFQALLDEGDEVLHQVPLWPTFPEVVRLAGGVPVGVAPEPDGRFDLARLEAAVTPRSRALLLVSPSNPTGATWDEDHLRELAEFAERHDLWIVTDEIYDRLFYAADWAPSLPVTVPEARDRTIVLNGVSKTYAMTGWRVGWTLSPTQVAKAISKLQGQMTSNVANVSQIAAVAALTGPQDVLVPMKAAFARRRTLIVNALGALPNVSIGQPDGAFYAYPDLRGAVEALGMPDTATFAADLLRDAGVAIVPGEAFGTPGFARLSFALADDAITSGVERIDAFLAGRPVKF